MSAFRPDVVAGRYDPSLFDPSGAKLLVNEIFYSMQGEGSRAGQATVFVRLAKCNLACKFCDTEFETGKHMTVQEILGKAIALAPDCELVDLTGGEPLLQNCAPLVHALHEAHRTVQVETSGSVFAEWVKDVDLVTCSPKLHKRRLALPEYLMHDVKWVVNRSFIGMYQDDPNSVYITSAKNYLQPESNDPKWTDAAIKMMLAEPQRYRLSLQLHKLAGVR